MSEFVVRMCWGRDEYIEETFATRDEALLWATAVDPTVFWAEFHHTTATKEQWGTNYHWLSIEERSTSGRRASQHRG